MSASDSEPDREDSDSVESEPVGPEEGLDRLPTEDEFEAEFE